jgi:hypothetical protein
MEIPTATAVINSNRPVIRISIQKTTVTMESTPVAGVKIAITRQQKTITIHTTRTDTIIATATIATAAAAAAAVPTIAIIV